MTNSKTLAIPSVLHVIQAKFSRCPFDWSVQMQFLPKTELGKVVVAKMGKVLTAKSKRGTFSSKAPQRAPHGQKVWLTQELEQA